MEEASKYSMSSPARAVTWNPGKPAEFAVGTFAGQIVLFDVEKEGHQQQLSGCSSKVLALQWHPLFDYILASGSADGVVRVWDVKNVSDLPNNCRTGTKLWLTTNRVSAVFVGTMSCPGSSSQAEMTRGLFFGILGIMRRLLIRKNPVSQSLALTLIPANLSCT